LKNRLSLNLEEIDKLLSNDSTLIDTVWLSTSQEILAGDINIYSKDSTLLLLANKFHAKGQKSMDVSYIMARNYFFTALKLRKQYYQNIDQYDVLRAYYNIGSSFFNETEYNLACLYFDTIQLYSSSAGFSLSNKAFEGKLKALTNLNEFDQANMLAISKIAEINYLLDTTHNVNIIIEAFGVLISLFEKYVDIEKEISLLQVALDESNQIEKRLVKYKSSQMFQEYSSRLANVRGILLLKIAAFQPTPILSNEYYQLAISNFNKGEIGFYLIRDLEKVATIKRNLTNAYFNTGEFKKGVEAGKSGIEVLKVLNDPKQFNYIPMYLGLGANLYRENQLNLANSAYYQALLLLDSTLNSNDLPNIRILRDDYQSSLVLLGSIGRLRLRLAQDSLALLPYANAAYDTLFALINDLRANLINDGAKMLLAKQSQEWLPDAFEDIKQLYYLSNDSFYLEQAFKIAEQGKAFALLEASRLKNASALLSKDLQKDQDELSKIELKAVSGSDSLKQLAEQKKMAFLSKLKKDAPEYFALKYKGPETNVQDIQKELIDSNQAILQYFVQEDRLNVFVLTKDLFALDTIPIRNDELYTLIDQFYANINPENEQGTIDPLKVKNFIAASNALYQNLLGKTILQHKLPERLIIIPDGRLNELSFDALLCKVDGAADDLILQAKNQNYFVQNKTISYCFSVSLLQEMKQSSTESKLENKLSLFAPVFQKESTLLPFMRNQEAEIKSIQAQVSSTSLSSESTKEEFLEASQKYKYLHLCAHGFVSQNPDQSFVAFRQNSTSPDTSQFFYLKELYHHKLNQDLITLTACETAVGELKAGEGNISMARGFAYAGVKAFITTLWKIQTNGAAQIIPTFYKYFLKERLPKDVALTQSKRDFLASGKGVYPENWAGMILIGNTASASIESRSNFAWLGYFGIGILVFFLFWVYKRK